MKNTILNILLHGTWFSDLACGSINKQKLTLTETFEFLFIKSIAFCLVHEYVLFSLYPRQVQARDRS